MSHPFIPAPNTCSVEMIYTVTGLVMENQFHVEGSAPFSLSDIQALRAVFDSWHNVTFRTNLSTDVYLSRIRTRALDSDTAPGEDYQLATPRQGTIASGVLPLNVTWACKLATGLTGRSARGRFYLPGVASGQTSSINDLLAARITAIINSVATLMGNITAANANWHLVVTSYRTGGAWRTTAVNYRVTGAVAADSHLDSQRRRLTGRGRT